MTWTRWWLVVILSTACALLVGYAAGDFDREGRAAHRQAIIERARATSGVDGRLTPVGVVDGR